MPLTLPNLDDRSYTDLVEEARAMIPTYTPEWTNHNPSDPGVMLVELFAYLTEMLIYRLNRITDDNIRTFLKLLNGPDWQPSGTGSEALAKDLQQTVLTLRKRERAVTCKDFENLALAADSAVARAHCVPQRNLALAAPDAQASPAPAHISLIVVIDKPPEDSRTLEEIYDDLWEDLDKRRLLTTRHHVVGPDYVEIEITATLILEKDALEDKVRQKAAETVLGFFDHLSGGPDAEGWPFGRDVYTSEVYELLEKVPGVDHVEDVTLATSGITREQRAEDNDLIGITLDDHELVIVKVDEDSFEIV